ncbi:bacterioferritin-associated ferredoxin [Solimonas terrae]|uniref:Bacterioferritin-associated ferredoxin n=1 Tax=Solimonas terrae TaxID=1396819 RepID=A0A6M2BT51_9GAMM|nr:bacterioferritin-associated ferredoxin [Solimonas terrae]NGY05510.1 (2Fe-2S)-binding protein [Solimonas terrae]
MFVCVCKAVSDRQIRRAVREDGVTSLRELARLHGVGTCCGKCVPQARELLGETLASARSLSAFAAAVEAHQAA